MFLWKKEVMFSFNVKSKSISHSVMSDSLWPMDHSPPGSSVRGILQAKILEWVAICFSRGSSLPRDWTRISCIADRFFIIWTTREVLVFNTFMKTSNNSIYYCWFFFSLWPQSKMTANLQLIFLSIKDEDSFLFMSL